MYPLETLNEIFPTKYRDSFYDQFYDQSKAWQYIISEFLAYAEGREPQFPNDDFSKLAKRYAAIEEWPYPERCQAWERGDFYWREVSYRIYLEQLKCIPPAKMSHGCFMVGEPYTYDDEGYPVYTAFVAYHNRYFCRRDSVKNYNPIKYKLEIQKQFDVFKA
jgi:hypothetical protein